MQSRFGSFEWGATRDGKLSGMEKLACIRTLAFLAVREATDAVRSACGLLRPEEARLEALAPPDSRLETTSSRLICFARFRRNSQRCVTRTGAYCAGYSSRFL
jgi:hypothetical protein